MAVVYNHGGHTLEISTEMIDVSTMIEPNPFWSFTDAAGHDHSASMAQPDKVTYPTLILKSGPTDWCDGDCDDDHWDAWFECRQCGEKIRPGTRAGQRRMIPGMTEYLLDGEPVGPDEARAFVTSYQQAMNHRQRNL